MGQYLRQSFSSEFLDHHNRARCSPSSESRITFLIVFAFLLPPTSLLVASPVSVQEHHAENCVFEYDNIKHGFLSTPNFPLPFPFPLHCKWIIRAPIDHVIVLYFAQFYLRQDFSVHEFAFYINEVVNAGGNVLSSDYVEGDSDLKPIVTSKSILVFRVDIEDLRNIHLRSVDFFLNVFGFNISFHQIKRNSPNELVSSVCNPFVCSLNGVCLENADHRSFYCQCFDGFKGQFCQLGPECDPSRGLNKCKNGGNCR